MSDPGEFVGNGQSVMVTPSTATITAVAGCNGNQIEILVRGTGNTWDLHMAAPRGTPMDVGSYDNTPRWPFQSASQPGLSFAGNGRGCNTSVGSFQITSRAFASDGSVQLFEATFQQRCEFLTPWLHGHVRLQQVPMHAQPFLVCS